VSRESYIRPPYNLDPFIPLDPNLADRLYGRITKIGRGGSRATPWVFLMKAMYGVLVGETTKSGGTAGARRPKTTADVKQISDPTIRHWAYAFNTAIESQHKAGSFRPPRSVDKSQSPDSWKPPLVLTGSQRQKDNWLKWTGASGKSGDNVTLAITNRILSVMEKYREGVKADVDRNPALQEIGD
jgi:hypothetical protein